MLAADLDPGANSGNPANLTAVGDSLFLSATTAAAGTEPWWLPLAPTLPAGPAALAATALDGGRVALVWDDAADNEQGYRLERSASPTFGAVDATAVLPANATRYTATGLTPGTTYFFRVRAFTPAGDSAAATASAVTRATPRPPTGLAATAISSARVDLAWADGSADETGFRIERSVYKTFAAIDRTFAVGPSAGPTVAFTDTSGVTKQTTYYYRVVAVGAAGDSAPAVASVAVPNAAPLPPTGLTARVATADYVPYRVVLNWANPADNATGFVVERRDLVAGGAFAPIATVAGASPAAQYLDDVPAGSRFAYRVRATNGAGASDPSGEVVAVAEPLAYRVAEIHPAAGSGPTSLTAFGGFVYFAADDGAHGTELWRSDGTAAGTALVRDINPQGAGSAPSSLVVWDGALYFQATDGSGVRRTWRSDGTAAGTIAAPGATPPPAGLQPGTTSAPPTVGPFAYYVDGNALWRTDGTPGGVVRLSDAGDPATTAYTVAGNLVYFNVGTQLYRTDGSAAGTRFVLTVDNQFAAGARQL
ncbi:MAG: hypothetical protein JWO31_4077, partial [Phycisphaerales bacterium]|nr:hypothetical protein [Phycisphaerales bacterium]